MLRKELLEDPLPIVFVKLFDKLVYKSLYEAEKRQNEKLQKEINRYICTALEYQVNYHTTLNPEITALRTFTQTKNIKLALFVLAYRTNKELAKKLAHAMRIEDEIPKALFFEAKKEAVETGE